MTFKTKGPHSMTTPITKIVTTTFGILLFWAMMVFFSITSKADDWRQRAFGSGNYITYGAADLPNRRQAYHRSTVTHIPVTRYRRVRIVPEHYEAVHRRRRTHYVQPRHWRDDDDMCHRRIAATGSAAQSVESAKARAILAWRGEVTFNYGDRYQDVDHARDPNYACAPSGVPDTVGGKLQDAIGINHFRCRFSAHPCRAEAKTFTERE